MAEISGEILIQEPSSDQGGAFRRGGNLSCLQTSGALKSPGGSWARLLYFYAKGPNRMRPGWKRHIIGTQKGRKLKHKKEFLIKRITGKVCVGRIGDNGIKICLVFAFVIIKPLAELFLSYASLDTLFSTLEKSGIYFLHRDSVLSLLVRKCNQILFIIIVIMILYVKENLGKTLLSFVELITLELILSRLTIGDVCKG